MEPLSTTTFTHYISNSSLTGGEPGACYPGSSNLIFLGNGRAQAFKGPAVIAGVAGQTVMFAIGDGNYAGLNVGSVIGLIARAIAYIGSGTLFINGLTTGLSASTALQMLLYRSGSWSGAGTGPYTFGGDPPTAPTLATTPTASTIMAGTYSSVHWFVRSATGGRTRRSTPSAVIVNSGFKMRHTVAGADLTYASTQGYDRIGIGVTAAGFGATGPHYELTEIAISSLGVVDGVANSVELEWSDGSLVGKDLAPILDYPPPAGVFAVAMEDVVAVIGCYGDSTAGVTATTPGTAIAVSLPVFIESFPPDNLLFLPAPPVSVLSYAADGYVFIAGKGYVAALLYTGGKNPLSLRVIWPTTGIAGPDAWCLGEGGRLYAATGQRGLVRINEQGEPDSTFARDIADDTANWLMSKVVVGYDPEYGRVCFAHDTMIHCYDPQTGKWDAPIDISSKISGTVNAMVTVAGQLFISAKTSNLLYTFNSGTGMAYTAVGQFHLSEAESDQLFEARIGLRSDSTNNVTFKIYQNGDNSTAVDTKTITPVINKAQHLPTQRLNVRGAKSHRVSISQTCSTGDAGPDFVTIRGVRSEIK